MIVIPDTFINRMHELHGKQGVVWAEALPGLINDCASRFDFSPEAPFSNFSYNFLLRAKRRTGSQSSLKLLS